MTLKDLVKQYGDASYFLGCRVESRQIENLSRQVEMVNSLKEAIDGHIDACINKQRELVDNLKIDIDCEIDNLVEAKEIAEEEAALLSDLLDNLEGE